MDDPLTVCRRGPRRPEVESDDWGIKLTLPEVKGLAVHLVRRLRAEGFTQRRCLANSDTMRAWIFSKDLVTDRGPVLIDFGGTSEEGRVDGDGIVRDGKPTLKIAVFTNQDSPREAQMGREAKAIVEAFLRETMPREAIEQAQYTPHVRPGRLPSKAQMFAIRSTGKPFGSSGQYEMEAEHRAEADARYVLR